MSWSAAHIANATKRLFVIQRHFARPSTLTVKNMSAAQSSLSSEAQTVLNTRTSIKVLDSHMSYLDTGVGDNTLVFLHGNPTSAFLWRNIIPHVSPVARCLAPDLIGMGHSGKPEIEYRFVDHYRYLSAWFEQMKLQEKVTIVCHDWGSGLGLHWCNQHRDRVQAIVYMEALVSPVPNWDRFPEVARNMFQALRSEAGEEMVLKKNMFVERLLPGSIMRQLADDEMDEYRAPFREEKARLPTLTWPREIPIVSDGPANVVSIVQDYQEWLKSSPVPKLYVDGDPGFFSAGIRRAVQNWTNQQTVTVKGLHFLQEDSPHDIGTAIRDFLKQHVLKV